MRNLKMFTAITALFLIVLSGCEQEDDSPVYNPNPDLAQVEPTLCDASTVTPATRWIAQQYRSWSPAASAIAGKRELQVDRVVFFLAVLFEDGSANQSYGLNGEYTDQLNKTFQELKRFWDIQSDDIVMVAAHGSMLQDRNKVYITYKREYGYSDDQANDYADSVATLLETYPESLNGGNPFFTFNGYAHQERNYPSVGLIANQRKTFFNFFR